MIASNAIVRLAGYLPLRLSLFTFALAIIEDRPVFAGDEVYDCKAGEKVIAGTFPSEWLSACSWNPPKPKTMAIELLREDVEEYAALPFVHTLHIRTAEACRKALAKK